MAKPAKSIKRARRIFSAEFKQEAVRRMAERRAQGVTVQQIGRDLDVRPGMSRVWARQLAAHGGAPLAHVFHRYGRLPSVQEGVRLLEREAKRLAQEKAFLKSAAAYFARDSR